MSDVSFHAPATLSEAVALAAAADAVVVGGATSLTPLLRERLLEPSSLVWLGRVAGLRGVSSLRDGGLRVGAMTSLADLADDSSIARWQPMVGSAARAVGNPRVRAVATVGGAVAHADPRQDLLPALLAADAAVEIHGPTGARTVRLADGFYAGFLSTDLGDGEIVTAVMLPPPGGPVVEAYERFTPGSREHYPTVGVAARVRLVDGSVHVRVGLGGVASRPLLVTALDVPAPVVAARTRAVAAPIDDERGSARYKAAMVEVLTRRLLSRLISQSAVT